jgi:hypothetical protein
MLATIASLVDGLMQVLQHAMGCWCKCNYALKMKKKCLLLTLTCFITFLGVFGFNVGDY